MDNRQALLRLGERLGGAVLGQAGLVEGILLGLLADGHLLVEGLPGLAKTRAIKCLAGFVEASFSRIQFTPDLLPSDVTGAEQYFGELGEGGLAFRQGPLFANLVLADEINRAPAKVQSALLEAMEERQVTVAGVRHPLPELFLVMATQNPIEHEGTYALPEAQLDRFLLHLKVDYPDEGAELAMMRLLREELAAGRSPGREEAELLPQAVLLAARREIAQLHVSPSIERYILDLVRATREPGRYDAELARQIEVGVSPRGTLALERVARAQAWLRGGEFVSPDDVRAVVLPVLRHRLLLGYEAQAAGIRADDILLRLLQLVAVA
ncbi:MoxR family ATPase [Pseudomonas sp.]|uniref:AAA family ATPase n=1 Tax=Pseudomonas sp. TaxID=306 RepID=UPI00261ED444|nr:AAA family ATPase [Pseudomonas sp.]